MRRQEGFVAMERFEHGGDVYTHVGVLDYSANLNPLGIPQAAKDALRSAIDSFDVYPDPKCTPLVAAIAAFEKMPERWVVPCAGATDAITRIGHAAALERSDARALVCAPCYSGYEQALEQAGIPIVRHLLREEDGLRVTTRILDSMDDQTSLVFLANPNNPTGLCLDRSVLEEVLEHAARNDALVALDECFIDLSCQVGSNDLLERFDNLVIVKALTKTFALAGLRVGYALCSSEGMGELLRSLGQMWAVSTPAQIAGVAALQERDYVERGRQMVAEQAVRLTKALEQAGMQVVPGQSNYLMFKDAPARTSSHVPNVLDAPDVSPVPDVPDMPEHAKSMPTLYEELLSRGILIRRCENYHGLSGAWYRIAVRTPEENDRFIRALKEVRP